MGRFIPTSYLFYCILNVVCFFIHGIEKIYMKNKSNEQEKKLPVSRKERQTGKKPTGIYRRATQPQEPEQPNSKKIK